MIADAEARTDDWFRDRIFDACVIGGGPAGITLARKLGGLGISVGLFEGGGLEPTPESQELYQGDAVGQPYYPLDGTRLRYFGGSSNHWGGWTRPLDADDFAPRSHHRLSGWPIAKSDLDPYAAEADSILDLPAPFDPPDMFARPQADLVAQIFRFSRPVTRFAAKYRQELERSEAVRVVLNANLVDLRLEESGRAVREAVFRSYAREEAFAVRARAFVLCLGGLENPRALLNANSLAPAGLGNEHDRVGRFFLEHLHAPVGRAIVRAPLTWMHVYAPSEALMRSKEILSFGLRIGDFDQWNAGDFTGALATQPQCGADFDTMLAAEMGGEPAPCPAHAADVFVACEQSLDPDNRVSLTGERDRFGLRKLQLDWRLSGMDLRTIRIAAETTARLMAEQDVGRMKIADWLLDGETPGADMLWGGNHHMGTTRMSADPADGVVDRNTRVHGLGNLYVGGSSVFATSGHANPTYTIVQLALRQGDHLRHVLQGG